MQKRELAPIYDPSQVESKWYPLWEEQGFFNPDNLEGNRGRFSIVIPPPNVTGSLHLGHALNNTLQDIIVRWKRMLGFRTLWLPGTDHAGIATQNVVERELKAEKLTRQQLGREKFIERVWQWKDKSGGRILEQLKRLGSSCDWSRLRFTMDEPLGRAVRENFVKLYEEGFIYRGEYLINWCPRCQTALSDLEVEHKEIAGHLWYIRYPLSEDPKQSVIVATTRPETMLGDTAVAVHPTDPRYQNFVGKKVLLPLLEREIPIIADPFVDQNFGTGAVKITPAHDFNDYETAKRHGLPAISVMDETNVMNANAGPFTGLPKDKCRNAVVEALQQKDLLQKVEDYRLSVGGCYRCHTSVEPKLSLQWFIRMKKLAAPAIQAVKEGKTRFIPASWEKTYFEWMENIRDWCISRQIWWGHPIPAWHCEDCTNLIVSRKNPSRCEKCGSKKLNPETDVLDTWFSSALWPFSTLGWPDLQSKDLKTYYPTDLLVTGFDIIFFWVARMMMLGLYHTKEVPFREVYITPLVRDEYGQKMSKSKGNVIDPLQIGEQYGMDALRFTLAALSTPGRDIRLSENRIRGQRNFLNKLWNASRFAFMNLGDSSISTKPSASLSFADRWILSRLCSVASDVNLALSRYRFDEGASILYHFVWHEFCDWYLEACKLNLTLTQTEDSKMATQWTLFKALDAILRLLHPFLPFVTEELWQQLHAGSKQSIMIAPYPEAREFEGLRDTATEAQMEQVMQAVTALRTMRTENGISPSLVLNSFAYLRDPSLKGTVLKHQKVIEHLARVTLFFSEKPSQQGPQGVSHIEGGDFYTPLTGVIDFNKECERLEREFAKITKDAQLLMQKLNDPHFLERAPEDIVETTKLEAKTLEEKRERIQQSLELMRTYAKSQS